jgi:hypothetical protein
MTGTLQPLQDPYPGFERFFAGIDPARRYRKLTRYVFKVNIAKVGVLKLQIAGRPFAFSVYKADTVCYE